MVNSPETTHSTVSLLSFKSRTQGMKQWNKMDFLNAYGWFCCMSKKRGMVNLRISDMSSSLLANLISNGSLCSWVIQYFKHLFKYIYIYIVCIINKVISCWVAGVNQLFVLHEQRQGGASLVRKQLCGLGHHLECKISRSCWFGGSTRF